MVNLPLNGLALCISDIERGGFYLLKSASGTSEVDSESLIKGNIIVLLRIGDLTTMVTIWLSCSSFWQHYPLCSILFSTGARNK